MKVLCVSLAAVVGISLAGPAAADATWLEEDFGDGVQPFTRVVQHLLPLDDGHTGPGARAVIPSGEHWGSSGHWEFSDHGIADPEELYWRYWIRFPDGFFIEPRNRGKLPGPANLHTYNCLGNRGSTPEAPCWSARMLFSRDYAGLADPDPNGPSDRTLIGFYAYHLDSPSDRGDIWTWDEEVALLNHGEWYCVEGRITLNTPGRHDGSLGGWVDGQAAFARDGMAFRRADEGYLDVDSFWFDVYYGGDESAIDNEIHFDSLALGSDRIGCEDGPVGTFSDDDGSVHQSDIEALAVSGITRGCNPPTNDRFCPADPVTRGQMAAFLNRALDLIPAPAAFVDVEGGVFEADVGALAASGITRGCNPPTNDRFCPEDEVTRGQMAAFLARALGLAPADSDFGDARGHVFETEIGALAAAGITRGCNPPANDRFCPDEPVTRAQMASFLVRAGLTD